ncbi:MAG: C-terminal binding protein [Burkholderiales bacterium]
MKILVTDHNFPDLKLETDLLEAAGIEIAVAQCRTTGEVIAAAAGCSALLVTYAPVDAAVLDARPEIGLISRIGAGFDSVNTQDAQARGVWVANSPDYGSSEVALHALSLGLALSRRLNRFDNDIRSGTWSAFSAGVPRRLAEMTVGVLGYGRIGSRFAYFAQTMFGQVLAHDPYRIDGDFAPYVTPVGLDELFERADLLSIHVPLSAATRHLVSARLLDRMKTGSILVNTARGAVVDVDALIARLDKFDGVGLDVLPIEPIPRDSPLLTARNVILTPHAAWYTASSERELRRKAAQNIISWMNSGRPDYPVVAGTRLAPAG